MTGSRFDELELSTQGLNRSRGIGAPINR